MGNILVVHAIPFSLFATDVKSAMIQRVTNWGFPPSIAKYVGMIMNEWYSGNTLNGILDLSERKSPSITCQQIPLNVLTNNVQGWGTIALEAIDLIFKTYSSICVFTEVGELWRSFNIPHFNIFYQKGTDSKGGVMIAVGKHLKATRIDVSIENTVIIDIDGLSETIRIIGIY